MKRLILAGIIFPLILACERIPFKEYALPKYNGELTWIKLAEKAEWSERYDHAAIAYKNQLWIFGGYNNGQVKGDGYYEDVWSSPDGINWTLVTSSAPWKGRRGHKVVVFNDGNGDALYLIGGFSVDESTGYRQYNNDVWKSEDGKNWIEIKPRTYPEHSDSIDWLPRMHHACIVAKHGGIEYIYLIGGRTLLENHNVKYASVYFNDVWRTTDGIQWEKLDNNDYGIRAEHAATVNPSTGRIYIQGGNHGLIFESDNNSTHPLPNWQYLWYTDDGIEWIPEANQEIVEDKYLFRSGHQICWYKDKLWAFPGKTTSSEHYVFAEPNYIASWTYEELGQWYVDSEGTDIDSRHSYALVTFNNKTFILGGVTGSNAQSNDVWYAE